MSRATVLGVSPDQDPIDLLVLHNSWGWAPSIWDRLVKHHLLIPEGGTLFFGSNKALDKLWRMIEELPEWQQAPLVLTFDVGVIPWQEYAWAAAMLTEFDRKLPSPEDHVNHIPEVAALFASGPEVSFIGVYCTSVSENPFHPWVPDDSEDEGHYGTLGLEDFYLLERHRDLVTM